MSNISIKKSRPISPFLSVYKPQVGSIVSILERVTGIILLLILILFFSLLYCKDSMLQNYTFYSIFFDFFKGSFSSPLISGAIWFVILSFVYHLVFSIRFLYWSYTGGSFGIFTLGLEGLYKSSSYIVLITGVFSFLIWILI